MHMTRLQLTLPSLPPADTLLPNTCTAAQPLMYSHAILAWWGQSVYLSLADHDEYLALANPERAANVQDLMAKCFDGLTQVHASTTQITLQC